jgi:hypothetical protein
LVNSFEKFDIPNARIKAEKTPRPQPICISSFHIKDFMIRTLHRQSGISKKLVFVGFMGFDLGSVTLL